VRATEAARGAALAATAATCPLALQARGAGAGPVAGGAFSAARDDSLHRPVGERREIIGVRCHLVLEKRDKVVPLRE